MPDEANDQQPNDDGPQDIPELRAAYRRERQRARELESQMPDADRIRRENALLRAGGDPDTRVGRLLLGDNDVDWSDREAVATAWGEVAPAPRADEPPPEPVNDGPTEDERAQQAARAALAADAHPPGDEPTPDPMQDAVRGYREDRQRGLTNAAAQRNAVQKVIDAASAGDERALFNRDRWEAGFEQ